MKYILIILCLIYSISVKAQIIVENSHGNIGETISINLKISKNLLETQSNINCSIEISNPTIFYPDSVSINEMLLKGSLKRKNDSLYSISFDKIVLNEIDSDTLMISIFGELLAGNDSLTNIDFYDFYINENKFDSFTTTVFSKSIGPPLPYIRKSTLEQNYPNPVMIGQTTKWAYRIDLETETAFQIYNLLGKKVMEYNLGILKPGIYIFDLPIDLNYSAGLYGIILKTRLNKVNRKFMVIK